jgi:hypothetical protein
MVEGQAPPAAPPGQVPPNPLPPSVPPGAVPVQASPLDEPLKMIYESARVYQGVRDYSCLFIKQERVGGQLQPENMMVMNIRVQPFSVNLRWLSPKNLEGQEVAYIQGQNNNMMRVHSTGLLRAVGFVSIDPNDPRAKQNSRHTINEAGLGNLIENCRAGWEAERRLNKVQVNVAEYEYAKRRCTRIETIRSDPRLSPLYRSVIYIDKETKLPMRAETYDWPRPGSNPAGDLLEAYSYIDLRFNIGLTDAMFQR